MEGRTSPFSVRSLLLLTHSPPSPLPRLQVKKLLSKAGIDATYVEIDKIGRLFVLLPYILQGFSVAVATRELGSVAVLNNAPVGSLERELLSFVVPLCNLFPFHKLHYFKVAVLCAPLCCDS